MGFLFTICLAVGIPFCALGMILGWRPPKKINALYGYRTPRSMQSQKHWDFAQRYSSKLMVHAGAVLIAASMFEYAIPASNKVAQYAIGIPLVVASVVYIFIKTERKLKNI